MNLYLTLNSEYFDGPGFLYNIQEMNAPGSARERIVAHESNNLAKNGILPFRNLSSFKEVIITGISNMDVSA